MAEQLTALSIMQNAPVIPVIVLHDVDHAVSMAKALVGGGIRVLEVTLRTPQGLPSIEAIAKADYPVNFEQLQLPKAIKKAMILHKGRLTPKFEYIKAYLSE